MLVKIYELRDPRDKKKCPRYIGMTTKQLKERLTQHIYEAKTIKHPRYTTHKSYWIRKLCNNNIIPTIHLIEEVEGWEYACDIERYWIKEFKEQGYKLTNCTLGGEGKYGYKVQKDMIRRGENSYNYRKDLDRQEIVNKYVLGKTSGILAKEFNTNRRTISNILKEYKIKTRNGGNYTKTRYLQYDLEGNFIKEWSFIVDIINEFKLSYKLRREELLGHQKCLNFMWKEHVENFPIKITPYKATRKLNKLKI